MRLPIDNIRENRTAPIAHVGENGKQPCIETDMNTALFELPIEVINIEVGLKTINGDKKLFQEMLGMLFDALPKELKILADAHTAHDWEKILGIAHKLKGSSSYCGALRLKEACAHLVTYIRTGATELREQLYKQVFDEIESFKQYYPEIKNDQAPARKI